MTYFSGTYFNCPYFKCIAAVLCVFSTALAQAQNPSADAGGFAVVNHNPLISIRGLGRDWGTQVTPVGQHAVQMGYSVASSFDGGQTATERVDLDGESERAEFRVFWGIAPGWEVGAEVPYVRHSGGYLDNLIIDWHDWFDLPQNGRDVAATGVLDFSYANAAGAQLAVLDDAAGLGDVQLFVGRTLAHAPRSATTLRAHLKLPTGDDQELLGSGGVDGGVSVHHWRSLGGGFDMGAWLGVNYLNSGDVLADQVRSVVGQAGIRTAWSPNDRIALRVQWDMHSQVYENSKLRQLNEIAYLLSFGGTVKLGARSALDIVVVENYLHPEISPDVAFQLAWRWLPQARQ